MRKEFIYFCAFILILAFGCFAKSPSNKKTGKILDEYLTRMSGFGFSGAVIVEKDNEVILRKGFGFANRTKNIPFTPETPYPAQSITKHFTAAAILKLEEQGKLNVKDSISKHIENVPDDKKGITIHHLLTHTSGMTSDYTGAGIFNRNDAVKAILRNPLGNPIGKVMRYNSDGYVLLGALIEIISGQNFREFLRQNLLTPARMKTAGFQGDGNFWKEGAVAHAYNSYFDNGSPQSRRPDWELVGTGNIVLSANDLFKWSKMWKTDKILSKKIKKKMTTPYADFRPNWKYGYGYFVVKSDRGTMEYYHGGGNIPQGYTASYTRYPSENMTIIIFTNTMIDELGFLIAVKPDITNIALGKQIKMPPDFTKSNSKRLKKYVGTYKSKTGEKFVVQYRDNKLMIGALNQFAIDFLTTPNDELKNKLKNFSNLTSGFVGTLVNDTSGNMPFQSNFEALEAQNGKFKDFELLGTYPVSEARKISTTYIKVNFEKGSETIRFVRIRDNNPYPLMGTPYPALTPIMPKTKSNFVAYYPFLKKKVEIKFKMNANRQIEKVVLTNKNQTISAKKTYEKAS